MNKQITLKNGKTALLRPVTEADAEEVLAFYIAMFGETENLTRYPDEVELTVEDERKYLKNIESNERSMMFCVVADGKIVATSDVNPVAPGEKCRHRAIFGITVTKDYWNLGIGSALTGEAIEFAKNAGYEMIELGYNYRLTDIQASLGISQLKKLEKFKVL